MTAAAPRPCGGSCPDVTVTCLDCRTAKPIPYQQVHEFEREHPKHAVVVHHRAVSS